MSRSRLKFIKKIVANFPDDPDKNLFLMKDIIAPRFDGIVLGEALRAVDPSKSPQQKKMSQHLDELINIMDEYVGLQTRNEYVGKMKKFRIILQSRIIRTRSKWIVRLAFLLRKLSLKFRWMN